MGYDIQFCHILEFELFYLWVKIWPHMADNRNFCQNSKSTRPELSEKYIWLGAQTNTFQHIGVGENNAGFTMTILVVFLNKIKNC